MRLESIAFSGYKAFAGGDRGQDELQRLDLAPLTIVFGKNNSGKSAVVRLPRLLLGGLECDDERLLPLEVRGQKYGGRFVDIVHGGAFYQRPTFEIQAEHQGNRLSFSATLYSTGALSADKPPQVWAYEMKEPESLVVGAPTPAEKGRPAFRGLFPAAGDWDLWRQAASALLDEGTHLGPMRAEIAASYLEEQPQDLSPDGREAPQWLRSEPELEDAVGEWFAAYFEGWKVSVSRSGESFSLRVGLGRGMMATNLAFAGEGLQQVLPIVVHQLLRQRQASPPFFDVIEHPDLHLHAAAQAPLADLFIDTALLGRGTVLVETHSEPLLLRVQRRVAEGRLPIDRVALYFVDLMPKGSRLRRVGLLPSGEVEWWPEGVFEEDFREVAAIRRAQRRTQAGGEPT